MSARLSSRGPASSGDPAPGARLGEPHEVLGDLAHGDRLHPRARSGVQRPHLDGTEHERRELVELGRTQNRPRHIARLDQPLLRQLPGVVAIGRSIRPDDRQRDVVRDARSRFRRQQVACGAGEERHRDVGLHARDVRHVDDRLHPRDRLPEPGPADEIHAAASRERDHLVAPAAGDRHHVRRR